MKNFNEAMREIIHEVVFHLEEFHFINLERVAISASYCKGRKRAGLLAYLLPLRYRDGSQTIKREHFGKVYHYSVSPVHLRGHDLLYIIYFMLPRFLNLSFRDRLDTIIHELYHISPDFNGDLRRLKGRSHLHGNTLKEYDQNIRLLSDKFLQRASLEGPLSYLKSLHGGASGESGGELESFHIPEPRPKLIHVEDRHEGERTLRRELSWPH